MKSFAVCVIMLLSVRGSNAQGWHIFPQPRTYETSPQVPEVIAPSLEPLDSACIAYGLTTTEVEDVLRLSVESTGWECRSGADIVIQVKLTPLRQRQEDLFTFQIDVAAGAQVHPVQDGSGGLSGSAIVDVPAGGSVKLLAQVNQLVTKVSRRLRQDIMKRTFLQGPPPDDNSIFRTTTNCWYPN